MRASLLLRLGLVAGGLLAVLVAALSGVFVSEHPRAPALEMSLRPPVGPEPASASAAPRPPSLAISGPYGDPLLVDPAVKPHGLDLLAEWETTALGSEGQTGSLPGRPREIAAGSGAPAAAAAPLDDEHDDAIPARPGTFKRAQTPIPGVFQSGRIVAPHLKPDVEIAVGRRTVFGVFGEVGRQETDAQLALSQAARAREQASPGLKGKDVGAGFSLQYRFGQ